MSDVLTMQQHDMITMMIEGESITDIAKKLNVQRQTVYNWLNKENITAELDRRRQELANRGNRIILKDITTYITNIKGLANNCSDKRVKLAANQYLLNRIYGNPTVAVESDDGDDDNKSIDTTELANELENFKRRKKQNV